MGEDEEEEERVRKKEEEEKGKRKHRDYRRGRSEDRREEWGKRL